MFLTRFIVASYAWLMEAFLWLSMLGSSFLGYWLAVLVVDAMGIQPTYWLPWRLAGVVLFPVIVLVILAVLIGPILILLDVRRAVWLLVNGQQKEADGVTTAHVERREPWM